MKKTVIFFKAAAIICGVALLSAGCGKEGHSRYAGTEVILSAGAPTSWGTKAAYAGYTEGSKYERIEWKVGDVVRLCSDKARATSNSSASNYKFFYSDYTVTSVQESSNRKHVADGLSSVTGNGLVWKDDNAHLFWGIYPAPGSEGTEAALAITGFGPESDTPTGTVTATLPFPATQAVTRKSGADLWLADLTKGGYMLTAGNVVPPTNDGKANFDFDPAFTSFEFVFGADTEMDVTGFEMYTTTNGTFNSNKSATALSGTATATLNGTSWTFGTVARTDENAKVSVTLSEPVKLIPASSDAEGVKEAHLTVLSLPQELSGITIKFQTSVGDRTLKLTQNGAWIDFPALKKAYIKGLIVPGTVWRITFDPTIEDWKELDETINLVVD